MNRFDFGIVLLAFLTLGDWSGAGPLEGSLTKNPEIGMDSPLEFKMNFKGGERATIIVKGDAKSKADLFIEIRDNLGQLITKDEGGGRFAAVIWYPTQTAIYRIKITNKAAQASSCYLVIR